MKNNIIAVIVLVALVVGGGAFFAGMKYHQSKIPAGRFTNISGARGGNFAQRGQGQGFRPVSGQIIGVDNNSVTVKLQDGSSKIVLLTDRTNINKSSQGSKTDLQTGENVAVFGTQNSDGSVTAQNVQLNPQLRGAAGSTPSGSQR